MVDKQNNHISITTISDQENWQKISICLKDRKLYETLSVALDALVKTKGKGPSASCKLAATSLLVRCFSNETCRGHKKICSKKKLPEANLKLQKNTKHSKLKTAVAIKIKVSTPKSTASAATSSSVLVASTWEARKVRVYPLKN